MSLGSLNPDYRLSKEQLIKKGLLNVTVYEYKFQSYKAELVPEPTNQYDPNAIKVLISGASCLAALGKRVLCVDMDIGLRNLDLSLGLTDRVLMDFSDVVARRCTLQRAAVEHPAIPGLHLITAPLSPTVLGMGEEPFQAFLDEARRQFDFILLDAPAGLGGGFQLAACGADRAIVVCTSDASSLRDAQRAVAELRRLEQVQLVVNRVQVKLLRQLRTTIDDAMDAAGLPLLGVVPEDQNVTLAANFEKPLVLMSHKGAALAYLNIARRMLGQKVPIMRIRR